MMNQVIASWCVIYHVLKALMLVSFRVQEFQTVQTVLQTYDDNILSFRFSAYGTLILFNIMNSYYNNKPITSEEIAKSVGATREMCGKILRILETKGTLKFEKTNILLKK